MKHLFKMLILASGLSQAAQATTFYQVCKKLEPWLDKPAQSTESDYIKSVRILYKGTGQKTCFEAHNFLTRVTRINLGDTEFSDLNALLLLPTKAQLVELDLSSTEIKDLTPLAFFPSLKKVLLFNTNVTNADPLAYLTRLEYADLGETDISKVSFASRNPGLKWLNLSHTGVSDLTPLSHCKHLEYLDLSETSVQSVEKFRLQHVKKVVKNQDDFAEDL